jgi:hypothetical protein
MSNGESASSASNGPSRACGGRREVKPRTWATNAAARIFFDAAKAKAAP